MPDRGPPEGDHPRQRPEPHRPGHRVRLLLRARVVRAGRGRLRDRDGQLQPGDRLHRLRHLRPAVLRAAHPRGRARGGARRAGQRPGRRGDRPARRADAARPGPGAGRGGSPDRRHHARTPSTWPRTGARSARVLAAAGLPAPRHGTATSPAEARKVADEHRLPGAGPAVLRARRPRHGDRLRRRHAGRRTSGGPPRPARSTRCWSTGSSTTRSRSTSTPCSTARSCTSAASWSTSRRPASTPATRPARCRRSRWATRTSTRSGGRTEAIARGVGVRGLLNVQYALAGGVLYVLEANPRASRTVPFVSKATAVPLAKAAARIMLGATVAGAARRGPAARGRRRRDAAAGRADRGQGGGAAVRAVPQRGGRGRRHRARAGDALDRRGHGHGRGVRHRVRQVPGGGLRLAAGQGPRVRRRWPTRTSARWCSRSSAWPISVFRSGPRSAPRRCCAATGSVPRSCVSTATAQGRTASPRSWTRILAGAGGPDREHAVRQPRPVRAAAGRLRDPHRRRAAGHSLHHDNGRAGSGRAGHRGDQLRRGGRAVTAGARGPPPGDPGVVPAGRHAGGSPRAAPGRHGGDPGSSPRDGTWGAS